MMMEKPFSLFVFGLEKDTVRRGDEERLGEGWAHLTLPKPTDVREEKVKYRAVIYLDVFVGPEVGSESL